MSFTELFLIQQFSCNERNKKFEQLGSVFLLK